MKFALDFDGVVNSDATFIWRRWLCDVKDEGHEVITVTSRHPSERNLKTIRYLLADESHEVVFSHDKPKKLAAIQAGHKNIQVWIDDNPHLIGDGTEDMRTHSVYEVELRHARDVLRNLAEVPCQELQELLARIETVIP